MRGCSTRPVPGRAALLEGAQPEPGQSERMPRQPQQRIPGELGDGVDILHEGAQQLQPRPAIAAEAGRRAFDVVPGHAGAAAGQRMPVGDLGNCEFDAVLETELLEELGGEGERMHRGPDIVVKSGQGEFGGRRPAADRRVALVDAHAEAGPGEGDCGGEAVRTGSDDDHVEPLVGRHAVTGSAWSGRIPTPYPGRGPAHSPRGGFGAASDWRST